jgi:hypothetical protein
MVFVDRMMIARVLTVAQPLNWLRRGFARNHHCAVTRSQIHILVNLHALMKLTHVESPIQISSYLLDKK